MLKLDTYQFGAELVTEEQLREGKRQLQRHRKNTERGFKRNALKNIIATFSGQKDDSSFFGKLLGGSGGGGAAKNKKAATRAGGLGLEAAADPSMREPAPLSGMVEKKAGYTIGVGNAFKDVCIERSMMESQRPVNHLDYFSGVCGSETAWVLPYLQGQGERSQGLHVLQWYVHDT